MSEGYIKIHRKMLDWEWYDDLNTRCVFLHLLLTANWRERRWHGIVIGPGQVITGRKQLAEEVGISERAVRTALVRLVNSKTISLKTTNKGTVITVENWAKYQVCDGDSDQQTTNKRPTNDQQTTSKEESKKERRSTNVDDTYVHFADMWNQSCPSLPAVKKMTPARKKKVESILKDYTEADLLEAMNRVEASDFLSGRNGGWKANFDWLINQNNFVKVLEGNYENKMPRRTRTETEFDAARRRIQEQYERVTSLGTRTASL